jgi:hypothetical protein
MFLDDDDDDEKPCPHHVPGCTCGALATQPPSPWLARATLAVMMFVGWRQRARRAWRALWWRVRGVLAWRWTCDLCCEPATFANPRAAARFCRTCWDGGLGGDE